MKTLFLVVMILFVACGPEQATKKDMRELTAEEQETKRLEAEKALKEQEAKKQAADAEKKKEDLTKTAMESDAVRERLKLLGMAAVHGNGSFDGSSFLFPGGRILTVKEKVGSVEVLQQLNTMLDKQSEQTDLDKHLLSVCKGTYEACIGSRMYVCYLEKKDAQCYRTWYEIMGGCK